MSKKIVLFGAGQEGKIALIQYGYENIYAFCDNFCEQYGRFVYGKKLLTFNELINMPLEEIFVVISIASKDAVGVVEQQLKEKNIRYTKFHKKIAVESLVVTSERFGLECEKNEILIKWLELKQCNIGLERYLRDYGYRRVAYYGDPDLGCRIREELDDNYIFVYIRDLIQIPYVDILIVSDSRKANHLCKQISLLEIVNYLYCKYLLDTPIMEGFL